MSNAEPGDTPDEVPANAQPALRTHRIELVPLADQHLELELELDSDPEVLRYLSPRARTRAEVEAAHRRRTATARRIPGLGFWVGFVEGRFVGWWILQPPDGPDQPYGPDQADLGYRLLRRWWRQGLAKEGAGELLRYGFEERRLGRIFAQTLAVNAPSRGVMTSLGMTFVRAFPADAEDRGVPGHEHGQVEYAITRDAWLARSGLGTATPNDETA